jgi:hypothetical protein
VEQSSGYSAVLGQRLVEACQAAKLEVVTTRLPAQVEAAERAKLAQCPAETNVIFTRAERARGPTAFGSVRVGRAFAVSGDEIAIDLANYQHDDWAAGATPTEEGKMRLAFELRPGVDKHVVSGQYPVRARGFEGSSAARLLWADVRSKIELRVEETYSAEVVARTSDKICGRFQFSDGVYKVRGTFALDLVVGRPAPPAETPPQPDAPPQPD